MVRPRATGRLVAAILMVGTGSACINGSKAVLSQQAEAHRLASHLHVQFTRAADASNRAVMADTDEASAAASREAQEARQSVQHDADALKPVLDDLGDRDETSQLEQFRTKFAEYQKLDDTILPLAVENTNIKAQRLSFGPGQEAVDAFRQAIDAAVHAAPSKDARVEAIAAQAIAALLDVQVMQARHIAESDETAMSRMESAMKASLSTARTALARLKASLPAAGVGRLDAAATALDRFTAVNDEIVTLSRRNSNVRSLALSLGRKRTITAECDDLLRQLEETLASHHFSATR